MVVKQALPSCEMLKCNSLNEKNSFYYYDINWTHKLLLKKI